MIREFKNDMANMFSLMERMDKHLTVSQKNVINEMFQEDVQNSGTQKMRPHSFMESKVDTTNKAKSIVVKIIPLFQEDVRKITRDSSLKCVVEGRCKAIKENDGKGNVYNGILLTKQLPYRIKQDNSNNTTQSGGDTQAQAQPQSGSAWARFKAGQNKAPLNEISFADAMKARQAQQQAAQAGSTQTGATQTQQASEPNDVVYKFFSEEYMEVINKLDLQKYDKDAVDTLKNWRILYDKFFNTVAEEDTIFLKKVSDDIKKEISEMIKTGDWSTVTNIFGTLDYEKIIYGNILSNRNQRSVFNSISNYGLNPGDPDYPRLIHGASTWHDFFGRRIVDNPKYRYPIVPGKEGYLAHGKDNKGGKAHYDALGQSGLKGTLPPIYGYDISDTVPIDPNKPDYAEATLGLHNNFGPNIEFNDYTKNWIDQQKQAQQASISPQQQKLLDEIKTEEGKARLCNEALMQFTETNTNLFSKAAAPKINDISNSTQPVMDFANNLFNLSKSLVENMGITNPTFLLPKATLCAFATACYCKTGSNEVLSLGDNDVRNNLQTRWNDANTVDEILGVTTRMINFIGYYISSMSKKIASDSQQSDSQDQQQATTLEESFDRINNILEGMF